MFDQPLGSGLENMRERRRFFRDMVIVAIILAILVNLFSTCLVNAFAPAEGGPYPWLNWAVISFVVLILFSLSSILFFLYRKETEIGDLALTLATRVDSGSNTVEFLGHKTYQPAMSARELFSKATPELKQRFAAAWPGANPIENKSFQPGHFCWDSIADLVDALIVLLLQNYGKHSLTQTSMYYAEFRQFAGQTKSEKLEKGQWPFRLQKNEFLEARGIKTLRLPRHSWLLAPKSRKKADGRPGPRILSITSKHGALHFLISPYWTILRNRGTALSDFQVSDSQTLCFLRIPVDLILEFRGGYGNFEKLARQYLWLKKLAENACRRMDWGIHLRDRRELTHDL